MISIQTPSGKKNLILRGIRTPSGNKAIVSGKILTPDGDKQFWDGSATALVVTATPGLVGGAVANPAPQSVITNITTAAASGGSPPYSYEWSLVTDYGAGGWAINNPHGAATSFARAAVDPGAVLSALFKCTATDARGATGEYEIQATVTNYGWG